MQFGLEYLLKLLLKKVGHWPGFSKVKNINVSILTIDLSWLSTVDKLYFFVSKLTASLTSFILKLLYKNMIEQNEIVNASFALLFR